MKSIDHDQNGRIDQRDPFVLYVSDKRGEHLKALTPSNENAVAITVFDKQDFALVKMQRDTNHNRGFESRDRDFYYCRLDLKTLLLGNKIELSGR